MEAVLKGKLSRDALTPAQRELAAQYYREVAQRTTGAHAGPAHLYNLERARYLEQGGTLIPPTLPQFIDTLPPSEQDQP